jgi:hypothetical protein
MIESLDETKEFGELVSFIDFLFEFPDLVHDLDEIAHDIGEDGHSEHQNKDACKSFSVTFRVVVSKADGCE